MGKMLTDAEMAALEAQEAQGVAPTKRMLTDEEMAQLEAQHANDAFRAQFDEHLPPVPTLGDRVQAGVEGVGQTASLGYLPQLQAGVGAAMGLGDYTKLRDENIARNKLQARQSPAWSATGKAIGMLGSAAAIPTPATFGRTVGQGAALGAAYNPGDTPGVVDPIQARNRAIGALIGAGSATAGYGASKALEKVGDYSMQAAVNRKKYTPGTGTTLADEGLWGTERMLKKQVGERQTDAFEDMLKAAQTSKPIDARQIGQEIGTKAAAPYRTDAMGNGMLSSTRDRPTLDAIKEFSDDVASRGQETAVQALGRRRAAGHAAYSQKTGNALQSRPAELSKMEQQMYSEALKNADPTRQVVGDVVVNPGRMAAADARYAALKKAERGLSEEMTMPRSLMGLMSLGANKLPFGSFTASTAGQLATKASRATNASTPVGLETWLEALRQSRSNKR